MERDDPMNASPALLMFSGLLTAFATCAVSAATVYKWVDEKGVVNYTTTPPANRKAAEVDVAPAVAARGEQGAPADYDEARYWRARSEREAASAATLERMRRETEQLHQAALRQQSAVAAHAASQKTAAQLAIEQCQRERRVDCDASGGYPGGDYGRSPYAYPQVVVTRGPAAAAPAAPYFSVTPNFTPGFSKPLVYSNRVR